jgi:hypothetical protein
MTILLFILGSALTIVLTISKTLAVDEVRGHMQRRIIANVEATIDSLPQELAAKWAEEWRGDLAMLLDMPVTAALYARGLRQSANQLKGVPQRRRSAGRVRALICGTVGLTAVVVVVSIEGYPISFILAERIFGVDPWLTIDLITIIGCCVASGMAVVVHYAGRVLGIASASVGVSIASAVIVAVLRITSGEYDQVNWLHGAVAIAVGISLDLLVRVIRATRARAEWAENWLGELAMLPDMPITVALYARGLRQSANQLKGVPQRRRSAGRVRALICGTVGLTAVVVVVSIEGYPISLTVAERIFGADPFLSIAGITIIGCCVASGIAVLVHYAGRVLRVASASVGVSIASAVIVAVLRITSGEYDQVNWLHGAVAIAVGISLDLLVGGIRATRARAKMGELA